MISRRTFIAGAPVAAVFAGRLQAEGIDGKWKAEIQGRDGMTDFYFDFKADGEMLSGTVGNDAMGTVDIADGKIEGDKVSFVQMMTRGNFQIRLQYEGTIAGDEIELTRTMQRPGGGGAGAGQRPGGRGGRPGGGQGGQGGGQGGPRGARQPGQRGGGQRPGGAGGGRPQGGGRGGAVTFTAKRVQ